MRVFPLSLTGAASKWWEAESIGSTTKKLIHYEDYEWYDTIEESELKVEALNNKRMLEELMNEKEESSDNGQGLDSPIDEWDDYEHAANIETDVDSNYNPYLDIFDYLMIIRLRMKARLFNMRSS
ncbi:hypothetical protein Tco_1142750 [Tanacetum coccineum]